jgi:hypothetical protein
MCGEQLAKLKEMRVPRDFLCVASQVSGRVVEHLPLFRQETGRHLSVFAGLLKVFDRAL